ncbi:MAG: NUDIX domain-containing protein [Propionibacteriaceae bacterium]
MAHNLPPVVHPDADRAQLWPVLDRRCDADASVFRVWTDTVETPDGSAMVRTYLRHPGAVAVLALDDDENVVTVRQYRHPARMRLLEPPAGLLDHHGEDPLCAAQRELVEEAGLCASRWNLLLDMHTSPGASGENIRVFLARGLAATSTDFVQEHEEADLELARVPLDALLRGIRAGDFTSPTLVAAVLAYVAFGGKDADFADPVQPWPGYDAQENDDVARS